MKKIFAALLALCMLVSSSAMAEMVLPGLSSVFGVDMPSLRRSALVDPVSEETTEDGGKKLTFEGITEDIFNDFSSYLSTFGCTLADYSVTGSTLTATVAKENATFTFEYNYETLQAVVTYPSGTNEEAVDVVALKAQREAIKASYQPGNYVTLGTYPQGANGEVEPIEWLVLDVQDGKALLISRYGLDAHRFDASTYQGWNKSEIREWLNSTFLNTAFTDKEQEGIETTTVKTGNNADWVAFAKKKDWSYDSVDGGSDTQDKIFLLSLEEAMEYGGYSTLEDFYNKGTEKLQAVPTAYAVAQGAYQYDGSNSSYMLDGTGCCWWWLRSPGYNSNYASDVYFDGSLRDHYVYGGGGAVRPAFWLNLDSANIY